MNDGWLKHIEADALPGAPAHGLIQTLIEQDTWIVADAINARRAAGVPWMHRSWTFGHRPTR